MKRLIAGAIILSVGFAMDTILWRMYANDKRIMKRHGIDEQKKNMREYKKYINEK